MKTVREAVIAVLFLIAYPANLLSAQDSPRISETQSVLSQLVESKGRRPTGRIRGASR